MKDTNKLLLTLIMGSLLVWSSFAANSGTWTNDNSEQADTTTGTTATNDNWEQTNANDNWEQTNANDNWEQTNANDNWEQTNANDNWEQTNANDNWEQTNANDNWEQTNANDNWEQTNANDNWEQTNANDNWEQTNPIGSTAVTNSSVEKINKKKNIIKNFVNSTKRKIHNKVKNVREHIEKIRERTYQFVNQNLRNRIDVILENKLFKRIYKLSKDRQETILNKISTKVDKVLTLINNRVEKYPNNKWLKVKKEVLEYLKEKVDQRLSKIQGSWTVNVDSVINSIVWK